MIILSGCRSYRPKVLIPLDESHWRVPSQAQQKDCFGNETRTLFRLTARLNDGHIVWRGWFEDRDDADAFLFSIVSGSLRYQRELWRLPTPAWHPGLGELLSYDFATVRFLTSTSSTNQTDTVPADWNSANNSIEVIASGASGAYSAFISTGSATGGGGAAYSKQTNVTLTPSGSATFFLNSGPAGRSSEGNGTAGPDAWYNGTTLAGSSVGAKGGSPGTTAGGGANNNGGLGGAAASGVGATKFSGGRGGNLTGGPQNGASTGAGGAAGPNGNGNNGTDTAGDSTTTDGGSADAGLGGAGGARGLGSNASPGGNGTEFDATHGPGGGGGGLISLTNGTVAGHGGNYGGAGGGAFNSSTVSTSGAGIQGIIVITYTPASARMRSFGTVIF